VKTKKQNINLRQLFRNKLENAEAIPDVSVKSKLMRRVARKEFLHFNPSRLNIYYSAGILVTGVTTAVLLFSTSKDYGTLLPESSTASINRADTTKFAEVPVKQIVRKEPEKSFVIHNESIKSKTSSQQRDTAGPEVRKVNNLQKANPIYHPVINYAISGKGVFSKSVDDKKKLQSGFNTEPNLIELFESSGCAPLKLRFYNKSTPYDSCRWTFGDGGFSNERDPEWIFDVEGEYKIALQVFGRDGRNSISTTTVNVYPRPQAHFEITPEKAVIPNDEIHFLNYSTNAVQFRWDFGDGSTSEFFDPSHTYAKYSNYNVSLVVFSDRGCSDTLKVVNAFSGSEYFIDFPNAFIPNTQGPSGGYYSSKSDEAAQVFHPSYTGVTEYHLKIFSKLGILIFESSDINLGWDGYLKGQLCESGVYIWKVRGKFINGEPFIKMGDVTMLKN
jgi:PKD repeat protein